MKRYFLFARAGFWRGTILATLVICKFSLSFSQADTLEIDEIVLTGKRTPAIYGNRLRAISSITKEEIEAIPVQSLPGILESEIQIDSRQRGAFGVQTDFSIRGGSFDQNLILLNGVKMNDPQTGHHNLNLPVPIGSIKKIEILKGPGSRLHGANAFSGALNLITVPDSMKQATDISFAAGQHDLINASVQAGLVFDDFWHQLSFSRNISKGYTENTDFDILNVFYQSALETKPGNFYFSTGYQDKEFGANSFYTPKFPEQFEHTRSAFAQLQFKTGSKNVIFHPNLYWRRHQDRFELFRNKAPDWYAHHNYHLTHVLGGEASLSIQHALGLANIGIEARDEIIYSNVLGNPLGDTLSAPLENNGFFTKEAKRGLFGLYGEQNIKWGKLALSGGAMLNWYENYRWKIFPGLDMGFTVTDQLNINASVNTSFRLPTFTDLYYEGPTNRGNANLKPEEAMTYEAGLQWKPKYMETSISLFHRQGKNIIDWVKMADSLLWESRNITELNTRGIEVEIKVNGTALSGSQNPFIKKLEIGYAYLETVKSSEGLISHYALDFLKHKANISVRHALPGKLTASWRLNYQDRAGTYTAFPGGNQVPYDPVWLLDTRVFWKGNKITYFADAKNLLNMQYMDIGNIQMPGRWIKGGIKLSLGF